MNRSPSILEKERALLASCKTDEERELMRVNLDTLWQRSVRLARVETETARLAKMANRLS